LCMYVFRMSATYGEYGLMKKLAKRQVPLIVKSNSRDLFIK